MKWIFQDALNSLYFELLNELGRKFAMQNREGKRLEDWGMLGAKLYNKI